MTVLGCSQVALIVLKLTNLADIDWWQVFIPAYIWLALLVVYVVFFLGGPIDKNATKEVRRRE